MLDPHLALDRNADIAIIRDLELALESDLNQVRIIDPYLDPVSWIGSESGSL